MALKTTELAAGRWARSLAVCLLVLGAGVNSLLAQARTEAPSDHALAHDVTRPYGEYEYVPQKGLYKDVYLADVVEDFGRVFTGAGAAVRKLNDYVGWSTQSSAGSFSINSRLGLQGLALPGVGLGLHGGMGDGHGLHILLGPLLLDNIYAGYGAMYSDINGTNPAFIGQPPDDRWVQIVWLSLRASLMLGDSIAISFQPMVYWLPSTGKVGWGMPGPFFGMFLPQMGPVSLLEVGWTKEAGNWKFALFDQFSPLVPNWSIWNVQLESSYLGDLSPVDRVGRYGVGVGGVDMTNYDPQARFGTRDVDWDYLGGFYNIAGFRAYGTHGYSTQSMFYFDRLDLWDKHFRDTLGAASIRGGAYLQSGDQFFSTYAGHNFVSNEPFNNYFNWAVVGAKKRLSPGISTYVQAGYFWQAGPGDSDQGWIGLVGFQHRISTRTTHGGEFGRRVFTPIRTGPGVETYGEYRVTHDLGLRSSLAGFAGISHRNFQASIEDDYIFKYAGVLLNTKITPRMTAIASAGWEEVEVEAADMIWDRWTYRLGLMYALTENIQAHCFYQYEDTNGKPINYSEHYLYLGVSKRF